MAFEGIESLIFGWHGVLDLRRFMGVNGVEGKIAHYAGGLNPSDSKVLHGRADDYARGIMPPEDFWSFLGVYFDLKRPVVEELRSFYVSVNELNHPLWDKLSELGERYKLGILSDCPPDKTSLIKREINLDVFKGNTYFSSDQRLTKNNFGFYELASTGLQVPREKCLFVDDSLKNVEYAQNAGLQTHLYQDNDAFLRLAA